MADVTGYASPIPIDTLYKHWTGCPPHLFGASVGRPVNTWAFADIYTATGLVIVRDDIFEGTVGVPYSFKTHAPGQVIARFTTNSSYFAALANGVYYGVVMNPIMQGVLGASPFILGDRIYYNTWRLRGIDEGGNGHVFAGSGVGANGISLTGMYIVGNPPTYVLSPDFTVGATSGDCHWQVEVGFGGTVNAVATALDTGATPEWPSFN